jgi:tetratricopeptide (TPR) repeat protein
MKIADDPSRTATDVAERALTNAFSHAVAKRDLRQVREIAQKVFNRYPRTSTAANAVLTLGRFATEMGDFDTAAQYFESMNDSFPGDPKALEALETAGTLRMMLGDLDRAVVNFEKVAAATRRGGAYAKVAEARLATGNLQGAENAARAALGVDPGNAKAAAVLGKSLLKQGKAAQAEEQIVSVGKALQNSADSDPQGLAEVYFLWGEAAFRQFQQTSDVETRAEIFSRLQQAYTSAAQMGGDWAIAGMYRLGQALSILSGALASMPEPAGLSDGQKAELRATLKKQSDELKKGSEEAFQTCAKKARELEVYTPFARGCITQQRDVNVETSVPSRVPAIPAERLKSFRQSLERNGSDIEALEGLGSAYLSARDYRRARLVYGRLVEVDESRSASHGTLGFVLLRMGEPDLAKEALQRAIELDGSNEKARANLAALMCRFGDRAGAKEQLASMKSAVKGYDVDPGYAACRN